MSENLKIDPFGFREYDDRWLYKKDINLLGITNLGRGLGSQIITFFVVFILPLFTWFCFFLLFLTYYGLTPLFNDMSEVCNPPGPDGPNCQYCPKGTIGCGDVYKKNE